LKYFIAFNQRCFNSILRSDKDHQLNTLRVWSDHAYNKSKMVDGCHFEKPTTTVVCQHCFGRPPRIGKMMHITTVT